MRFPWAQLYLNLAEKYKWSFETIGRLTLYQAYIAAGALSPEHGRLKLNDDQSRQYIAAMKRRNESRGL